MSYSLQSFAIYCLIYLDLIIRITYEINAIISILDRYTEAQKS